MAQMLKVGGVPEHFNLPWHIAIKNNQFKKVGISVKWADYPGGTGAMMQDIRDGHLDVAVALTEGAIAEIVHHYSCKILQLYVQSPLTWGIHVAAASTFQLLQELEGKRFAISRPGSGSHLMAYVNAKQLNWNPNQLTLVPISNLNGARKALAENEADGFMWEKFMTKPLVDQGEFRRIGECPTPWPCFIIVASKNVLANQPEVLPAFLKVINQSCMNFMRDRSGPQQVSDQYGIQFDDAKLWFSQTKWATDNKVAAAMLSGVMDTLSDIGSIKEKVQPADLCGKFCQLI